MTKTRSARSKVRARWSWSGALIGAIVGFLLGFALGLAQDLPVAWKLTFWAILVPVCTFAGGKERLDWLTKW